MIAILHQRQHDIVTGQTMRQRERMLPWHIRVFCTLKDTNRTADIDRTAKQKMIAAFLDQLPSDRIRLAIIGGPQPHASRLQLLSNFR